MFNGFKKDEIFNAARVLHVDVDPDATIAEVKAAILDSGQTEEDYYETIGEKKEYSDQEKPQARKSTDDEEQEQNAAEVKEEQKTAKKSGETDTVVGRFLGSNLVFQTKHGKFSRTKPLFVTSKDKLAALQARYPDKFRKATAAERDGLR